MAAEGEPFLISNATSLAHLPALRLTLDGVLLSGGGDIDPVWYSAEPHPSISGINKSRDRLEIELARLAVTTDWPLLGICRGCQVLNVALAGSLYTHIPDQVHSTLTHNVTDTWAANHLSHEVEIHPGSVLSALVQRQKIMINSRHHQGIRELAAGLVVTARSSDDLIEAVEMPGKRFCLAVQWHPENLQHIPEHQGIFTGFVAAARSSAGD
jgi:putative glutamine amidotransferase